MDKNVSRYESSRYMPEPTEEAEFSDDSEEIQNTENAVHNVVNEWLISEENQENSNTTSNNQYNMNQNNQNMWNQQQYQQYQDTRPGYGSYDNAQRQENPYGVLPVLFHHQQQQPVRWESYQSTNKHNDQLKNKYPKMEMNNNVPDPYLNASKTYNGAPNDQNAFQQNQQNFNGRDNNNYQDMQNCEQKNREKRIEFQFGPRNELDKTKLPGVADIFSAVKNKRPNSTVGHQNSQQYQNSNESYSHYNIQQNQIQESMVRPLTAAPHAENTYEPHYSRRQNVHPQNAYGSLEHSKAIQLQKKNYGSYAQNQQTQRTNDSQNSQQHPNTHYSQTTSGCSVQPQQAQYQMPNRYAGSVEPQQTQQQVSNRYGGSVQPQLTSNQNIYAESRVQPQTHHIQQSHSINPYAETHTQNSYPNYVQPQYVSQNRYNESVQPQMDSNTIQSMALYERRSQAIRQKSYNECYEPQKDLQISQSVYNESVQPQQENIQQTYNERPRVQSHVPLDAYMEQQTAEISQNVYNESHSQLQQRPNVLRDTYIEPQSNYNGYAEPQTFQTPENSYNGHCAQPQQSVPLDPYLEPQATSQITYTKPSTQQQNTYTDMYTEAVQPTQSTNKSTEHDYNLQHFNDENSYISVNKNLKVSTNPYIAETPQHTLQHTPQHTPQQTPQHYNTNSQLGSVQPHVQPIPIHQIKTEASRQQGNNLNTTDSYNPSCMRKDYPTESVYSRGRRQSRNHTYNNNSHLRTAVNSESMIHPYIQQQPRKRTYDHHDYVPLQQIQSNQHPTIEPQSCDYFKTHPYNNPQWINTLPPSMYRDNPCYWSKFNQEVNYARSHVPKPRGRPSNRRGRGACKRPCDTKPVINAIPEDILTLPRRGRGSRGRYTKRSTRNPFIPIMSSHLPSYLEATTLNHSKTADNLVEIRPLPEDDADVELIENEIPKIDLTLYDDPTTDLDSIPKESLIHYKDIKKEKMEQLNDNDSTVNSDQDNNDSNEQKDSKEWFTQPFTPRPNSYNMNDEELLNDHLTKILA